jgi:hypothetical protein
VQERKKIKNDMQVELFNLSKRRCCICYSLDNDLKEKRGQIAHLDGDRNNNIINNLVWLCLEHHDKFDSRSRHTKGYQVSEVKAYRKSLYLNNKEIFYSSPINKISNLFIKKCKENNIDMGHISEAKRIYNPGLEIINTKHNYFIDGKNLKLDVIYSGLNCTNKLVQSLNFNAVGAVPSYINDMNVFAIDIDSKTSLKIQSNDDDLNVSKNFSIIFQRPLKFGEHFNIRLGFELKNTIKEKGKDYLISVLAYNEIVKQYEIKIRFDHNIPKYIELYNFNLGIETLLQLKNTKTDPYFSYKVKQKDMPDLNNLRLLLCFSRQ